MLLSTRWLSGFHWRADIAPEENRLLDAVATEAEAALANAVLAASEAPRSLLQQDGERQEYADDAGSANFSSRGEAEPTAAENVAGSN